MTTTRTVDPKTLKNWLHDGAEIAFFDVREHGQYGEGHPFYAVPLPWSRFELDLERLAPRPGVRMVLLDDGDGVAQRAAARAQALGYSNVHVLDGGAPAWKQAGFQLFAGVNVPSKTFGELVEHACDTPRITAEASARLRLPPASVAPAPSAATNSGRCSGQPQPLRANWPASITGSMSTALRCSAASAWARVAASCKAVLCWRSICSKTTVVGTPSDSSSRSSTARN